jgi:hypothetical protein
MSTTVDILRRAATLLAIAQTATVQPEYHERAAELRDLADALERHVVIVNGDDDDAPTCECCDSASQHEERSAKAAADFLASPGFPPDGWSDERIARARAAMARKKAG